MLQDMLSGFLVIQLFFCSHLGINKLLSFVAEEIFISDVIL